jgi:predicted DNA-binding WGR domain protein
MAKLVWVGSNQNNKGGTSSKGYTVRRIGRVVDVDGGRGGKYYWRHRPVEKRRPFRTEAAAAAEVKALIQEKGSKGYDLLPGRVPIRPPRKNA